MHRAYWPYILKQYHSTRSKCYDVGYSNICMSKYPFSLFTTMHTWFVVYIAIYHNFTLSLQINKYILKIYFTHDLCNIPHQAAYVTRSEQTINGPFSIVPNWHKSKLYSNISYWNTRHQRQILSKHKGIRSIIYQRYSN